MEYTTLYQCQTLYQLMFLLLYVQVNMIEMIWYRHMQMLMYSFKINIHCYLKISLHGVWKNLVQFLLHYVQYLWTKEHSRSTKGCNVIYLLKTGSYI